MSDLFKIDDIYFEQMFHIIYPAEVQLKKAYSSDSETALKDFNLCISPLSHCIFSTHILVMGRTLEMSDSLHQLWRNLKMAMPCLNIQKNTHTKISLTKTVVH